MRDAEDRWKEVVREEECLQRGEYKKKNNTHTDVAGHFLIFGP